MDQLLTPFLIPAERFSGPVLVTGAGGCLGAWVLAILQRSGVPVVAFDLRDDRRRAALVMGESEAAGLTWETGDITDFDVVKAIAEHHQVQAIVHFAGLQIPFCAAQPALGARVNVEGTINVLQTARELGIKRTVYASSMGALGMPPGGPYKETLYGVYKVANEHSAFCYWNDWQVPSVGIRPSVVYGVARDQGMTSKGTLAIQAAVLGQPYEVPYTGDIAWLYAGEAASAFIAAVSRDGDGAPVFDMNGACGTVEEGLAAISALVPTADIRNSGGPMPFPADLDDGPLRAYVGDYPSISIVDGIAATHQAFVTLQAEGRMPELPV